MKKCISLFFAVVLLISVAVPVYAGYYNWSGQYQSSPYEVSDTVGSGSYRSVTTCESPEYLLQSHVSLLGPGIDLNGKYVSNAVLFTDYGSATRLISTTSGTYNVVINEMRCTHYINGDYVHTSYVTP